MSSRSFRRRNNRRRHKPGVGPEEQQQKPEGERQVPAPGGKASHQTEGRRGPRRDGRPGGRGQPAPAESGKPAWPVTPQVFPDCPLCGKSVRDLASALTHRITRQPAHFECIMKEIRDANEVAPQERVCYLGGGSFGILEFRPPGGPGKFVIRKRIQYEEKETPQEWKKTLQVPC
jgi:hypothetical protein